MSEGLEKLNSIGAQKIYETTHIARTHIQAILKEDFENMGSVQFFGFVSILEREYSVDLSELKKRGKDFFNSKINEFKDVESAKVFVSSKKKRNYTALYIAIGLIVFIVFSFFNIKSSENDISQVDDSAIESAKNNLSIVINDANSSIIDVNTTDLNNTAAADDKNDTVNTQEITAQPIESVEQKKTELNNGVTSFKITPNSEVWLGYIDLSTYKRYQKTFSDEFALDPSKDWLLAFGHGLINIEVNGIIKKFTTTKNIRFVYKDSELKEIDLEEFKNLNRGSRW